MVYPAIEDHAIIGNMQTAALVTIHGEINFLCFPTFESPSIFLSLLDDSKGGRFKVAPESKIMRTQQFYYADTNVLVTRFNTPEGIFEVQDYMPVKDAQNYEEHTYLIRRLTAVRGNHTIQIQCSPRYDYARDQAHAERIEKGMLFHPGYSTQPSLCLYGEVEFEVQQESAFAAPCLEEGASTFLVLTGLKDKHESFERLDMDDVNNLLQDTLQFWRSWVKKSKYSGRWQNMVKRSALTLKLLQAKPHGSIIAAPTFGLPENIGGGSNWDYRYVWIRDCALSVDTLHMLGYKREAKLFVQWLERLCTEEHGLQVMYGTDGHSDLEEQTLDHLQGYRSSTPVQIGNGANKQLQLDIFGELLQAVYSQDQHGEQLHHNVWKSILFKIDWLTENWQLADEGIWEFRDFQQESLYSRLMSWVAIDRAIKLSEHRSYPADLLAWRKARDTIHANIHDGYWDDHRNCFVQYAEHGYLDAALLRMPLVGFISATDPKWLSTLDALKDELFSDILVHRYQYPESLESKYPYLHRTGTFSLCTFWYVECLALAGRLHEAVDAFDKMLGYTNHVGLYAEQIGPHGEQIGNFPQAFTHLGLIRAAHTLDRVLDSDVYVQE